MNAWTVTYLVAFHHLVQNFIEEFESHQVHWFEALPNEFVMVREATVHPVVQVMVEHLCDAFPVKAHVHVEVRCNIIAFIAAVSAHIYYIHFTISQTKI